MFIDNTQYQTNLVDVNNIRYLLCVNFYSNPNMITNLAEIIRRNIECLSLEFSAEDFSFMIKIKKTAMRKLKGFEHNPSYYYQTIAKIFKEYISNNEQVILHALKCSIPDKDPYMILRYIYDNQDIMANLCHVTCIFDNTLIIKL